VLGIAFLRPIPIPSSLSNLTHKFLAGEANVHERAFALSSFTAFVSPVFPFVCFGSSLRVGPWAVITLFWGGVLGFCGVGVFFSFCACWFWFGKEGRFFEGGGNAGVVGFLWGFRFAFLFWLVFFFWGLGFLTETRFFFVLAHRMRCVFWSSLRRSSDSPPYSSGPSRMNARRVLWRFLALAISPLDPLFSLPFFRLSPCKPVPTRERLTSPQSCLVLRRCLNS